MTAYRFGTVGFAILGVYMVITAITQIPSVAMVWSPWTPTDVLGPFGDAQLGIAIGATLNVVFYLFAGVFLVSARHQLARWAVGKDQEREDETGSRAGFLPMAYSVLGLYLVVVYGSALVGSLPSTFVRAQLPGGGLIEMGAQAGPVVVGLLLFFRSQWVAGLWSKSSGAPPEASVGSVASRWSRAGRKQQGRSED